MAFIKNLSGKKLSPSGKMSIMPMNIPSFKNLYCAQNGILKNVLIYVVGGLGDAICAEPAIRFATETFSDFEFTIATRTPEIYRHLRVKEFIDFKLCDFPMDRFEANYNCVRTLWSPDSIHSEFIPHFWMNVIDYHSISMWKCQLDRYRKNIVLTPTDLEISKAMSVCEHLDKRVVLHPGKTWPSRTIPAWWWDELIYELSRSGVTPIVIGDKPSEGLSTVAITSDEIIDMRGRLSIMETVALCQMVDTVVTNDSSPIHMAASGEAKILFFATIKHPDFITHWRGPKNEFGWRMYDIAENGLWQDFDVRPDSGDFFFDRCTDERMKKMLPDPREVLENYGF